MDTNNKREKAIVKTGLLGIFVNILLASCKAIVGLVSNSIAIVLDAVNNLSDALSSVITIIGTKLALKPANKKHPYGYGRYEYLSALIVSVIILYAGVTSFIESCKKILNPEASSYSLVSLIIIGVAVLFKIFLGLFVKKVGKKYNSGSLVASGQDSLMDSIISASTLVSAVIVYFTGKSFEAFLGLVISVFIIKSGIELIAETVSQILGERLDGELAKKIKSTITSTDPEIKGAYDLILNNYGPDKYLGSVHIEIPHSWNAEKIDMITRLIQNKVFEEHQVILSAIGIYSTDSQNAEAARLKQNVLEIAQQNPDILQIHGFFADLNTKRVTLDVVISFDSKNTKKVYEEFSNQVKKAYPDYDFYIQQDSDFSD